SIADYFHSGSSRFPLQFGSRIVYLPFDCDSPDSGWSECRYLLEQTGVRGVTVLRPPGCSWGPAVAGLADANVAELQGPEWQVGLDARLDEADSAVLVMPAPRVSRWVPLGLGNATFVRLLESTAEPVLVARGTIPYRRILLSASEGPGSRRAAELALDLARNFKAHLTAVVTLPPVIVTGEDYNRRLRQALGQVSNLGPLYGVNVSARELPGNPVRAVLHECREHDLLVLSHRCRRRFSLTQPDVSRYLLLLAPCSVMVLPDAS
ncbi:MAG: universal stress protein, partial [Candidatus Eremiobacterota bacterium]